MQEPSFWAVYVPAMALVMRVVMGHSSKPLYCAWAGLSAARGSGPARVSPSRRAPRVVRQQVRLLIEACWADDGRARPRASHVAEHVGSIELALTPAQRQWLDCPAGHRLPEGAPAVLCRLLDISDLLGEHDTADLLTAENFDELSNADMTTAKVLCRAQEQ